MKNEAKIKEELKLFFDKYKIMIENKYDKYDLEDKEKRRDIWIKMRKDLKNIFLIEPNDKRYHKCYALLYDYQTMDIILDGTISYYHLNKLFSMVKFIDDYFLCCDYLKEYGDNLKPVVIAREQEK